MNPLTYIIVNLLSVNCMITGDSNKSAHEVMPTQYCMGSP